MGVHELAIIEKGAEIGEKVNIGPFVVVESGSVVGDGVEIMSHAVVKKFTRIGKGCRIGHGAVLGGEPQDVKFHGEKSFLDIGEGTVIREYVTAHRADGEGESTVIGRNCMIMCNCHIGHNCKVGDEVVMANLSTLGGFVRVGRKAFLGGLSGVHQFCRVGEYVMLGGGSTVLEDVPPYMMVAGGHRPQVCGLNTVGLMRANFSSEARRNIRLAYRILYKQGLTAAQAAEKMKETIKGIPEVDNIISFIETTERGISFGRSQAHGEK